MNNHQITRIKSITEFHRSRGLPPPKHPLISVVDYAAVRLSSDTNHVHWVFDFYATSLKRNPHVKMKYGQQQYDFDEGILFFIAPDQVFTIEIEQITATDKEGWILLIHPDFLWNTPLSKTIRQYEFFDYAVNEALFLSESEEVTLNTIVHNIQLEYHSNIDTFSQDIIIAQLELLLRYAERFYQRQFITRNIANHQVLDRLEKMLNEYFSTDDTPARGLPTVQYIAESLHLSPGYLSSVLKVLTGQNTQQHIHNKLIEKAKQKLSTTNATVSEIAYALGFEHPQSFSKFFKNKTQLSPIGFRQLYN